ncbi:DddA-like double-stranded DNA deaminase toxin [Kribbella sp. NPDC056951]|uniref:DddA-like double-stranded DNA deaminase toxin n=1 Tax=Kribbella sp. NPDC056951 TaxID=3345978 RepID=UPI00364338AD
MASELQRVAQSLLAALDEIPRNVPYLQDQARRYREAAGWVAALGSNLLAQAAAVQLDGAANRCEEAAHFLALAPPKSRAWVEQMVAGERRIGPTGDEVSPVTVSPDQSGDRASHRPTADDVQEILRRLPVRDESKSTPDKTRGRWIGAAGDEEELVSGYDRYSAVADEYIAREKVGPPPHSLRIAAHVEVKFAMMMREWG